MTTTPAPFHDIALADLKAGLADGSILLVDVREAHEHAMGRIAGSISAPLSSLTANSLPKADGQRIVLACQAGKRSAMAVQRLAAEGRGDVDTHFAPGFAGWAMAGGRVEAG